MLPKLFWPTVRKKCFSDWEKLLKFEVEGQGFTKTFGSLEQFIQTVKGQNNLWNRMSFWLVPGRFSALMNYNNYNSNWKRLLGFRNPQEKNRKYKFYFFFLTCWCSSHCGDWRFHWPPTFFLDWPRTSISWNSKHYFFWLCSLINQMLDSENFQTLMHT